MNSKVDASVHPRGNRMSGPGRTTIFEWWIHADRVWTVPWPDHNRPKSRWVSGTHPTAQRLGISAAGSGRRWIG